MTGRLLLFIRSFVIVISLLLGSLPLAYSQGVSYFRGADVYSALSVARSSGKYLLVEFDAPWNYKSRWMHQMMNSSQAVCDRLAQDFVVFRVDTREASGASLAQVYSVTDYPYLLVFDDRGNVLDRVVRSMEPSDFISFLDGVSSDVDASLQWQIDQIVLAGDNMRWESVDLLFSQLESRYSLALTTLDFWEVFSSESVNRYSSLVFDYFADHILDFKSNISDSTVSLVLERVCRDRLLEYLLSDLAYDSLDVDRISGLVEAHVLSGSLCLDIAQMLRCRSEGDVGGFLMAFVRVRNSSAEEDGFTLTLALDFVAENGSREERRIASRYIDNQLSVTKITSQRRMLMALKDRF